MFFKNKKSKDDSDSQEKKDSKTEEKVYQQDLSQEEKPGIVFVMRLLMKNECAMPDKERMTEIMQKHLGEDTDCFCHSENVAGFAPRKYEVEFKEGKMPPQLMITSCCDSAVDKIDEFTRSQMWDCMQDRDRILSECKFQVVATDMLAGAMEYKDRADMLMDYMEALVEIYPECEAILFPSGKMFTAEAIRNHNIPREDRFIYFAVNVRFFNIQGTEDMMVDTLGMSTLFMPDLQYHFHGMDPNWVVNHAYNLLSYIYANDNPIKSGETVDGISDGKMDMSLQWKCHYEDALIQPARGVLDICMNEYAAGGRNYD